MNNHALEEDRRLLSRCFSGEEAARETLVRQLSNLVYQAVQHTLKVNSVPFSRFDLEDFHNTVFLKLFENDCTKLRQYRGKNGCRLATWVRLVSVRIVLDHLRKKGLDTITVQKSQIPLDEVFGLKARDPDTLTMLEKTEQLRVLKDAVSYLPPRDRLFFKLHFERDIPVAEVAAAMQLSVNNVYTVKHRVIQKLRSQVVDLMGTGSSV